MEIFEWILLVFIIILIGIIAFMCWVIQEKEKTSVKLVAAIMKENGELVDELNKMQKHYLDIQEDLTNRLFRASHYIGLKDNIILAMRKLIEYSLSEIVQVDTKRLNKIGAVRVIHTVNNLKEALDELATYDAELDNYKRRNTSTSGGVQPSKTRREQPVNTERTGETLAGSDTTSEEKGNQEL